MVDKEKEPSIVVLGGGTGMPVLLRGLKDMPINLTALVNVADDGGSTGRIRREMDIPAPGDIRNVIAALSDAEPMLINLFQHRFEVGNGLSGHSMGNLLLAALTSVTGNFNTGIREISRVLNVKGKIYPISNDSLSLHAEMDDGTFVVGESTIPLARKKIKWVFLTPQPIQALPNAIRALENADMIVISPGSLYTSILPNLIIPQIDEAIRNTKGKVVYVCNVMTQAGETTNYTAADHVRAIYDHIGPDCIDSIIINNAAIKEKVREAYAKQEAEPVVYDIKRLRDMGLQIIEADIIEYTNTTVRHNTQKIAKILYSKLR